MKNNSSDNKNIIKKITQNPDIMNGILFVIFALITLYLACKHELWRDEAQNWLLNRDLSFLSLFKQLKIEGHPFAWLYFLRVFVKIGFPYQYSFLIPWSLSLIIIFLVLWKMPYPFYIRILALCTSPYIYIAPVFVRSYCFVVLFITFLAVFYKDRLKHPYLYGLFIFLLLNTHIITCGIPFSLMAISFFDSFKKEKRKSSLIIMSIGIIGFIFLILQLMGASSYKSTLSFSIQTIINTINTISMYITGNNSFILLENILLFILFIYLLIKKEWYLSIIYLGSYFSVVSILLFSHSAYYLCLMIIPGIIFAYWNLRQQTIASKFLFAIFLLFSFIGTYNYIKSDIQRVYSSGYETSIFIKNNIKKGSTITCDRIAQCSAIIPYFHKDDYIFFDPVQQEEFTYVDWKKFYVEGRTKWRYPVNSEYAIISYDQELVNFDDYEIIYTSSRSLTESFKILKKSSTE